MKARYGIDAPPVMAGMIAACLAGLIGAWASVRWLWASRPVVAVCAGLLCLAWSALWTMPAIAMFEVTLRAKFAMRDRLLRAVALTGAERVLDVGCGRGMLLLAAAKRLTSGKAVGVDVWRGADQSGNSLEATLSNARLEGVADKIEVQTADARRLPFPDVSFDVVVSSLAIHNIDGVGERAKAMAEIVRVLKPGGRVAIWDIQHAAEYRDFLQNTGWKEIEFEGPLKTYGEHTIADHLLVARKPA